MQYPSQASARFPLEEIWAREKLQEIGQSHLLCYWQQLSTGEREGLLEQIQQLDLSLLQQQRQRLNCLPPPLAPLLPFEGLEESAEEEAQGLHAIAAGQVGTLLIAGGQGSRLQFEGPKGIFPISVVKRKSLYQLFAEKVRAASQQVQRLLPLAIMTSPLNHDQTVEFFHAHRLFGLHPHQLHFFCQNTLPLLDDSGNLFLDTSYHIAEGPDGNGSALHLFYHLGLWQRFYDQGIRHLTVFPIDNPLANPLDPHLIGFHLHHRNEISLKCTRRKDLAEKVGLVIRHGQQLRIVEYSEFPKEEWAKKRDDGSLLYDCAHIGLFCFQMEFLGTLLPFAEELPLHCAHKAVKYFDTDTCTTRWSSLPMAWKFERFLFDILRYTEKGQVLLSLRESCYAPLKNSMGEHTIASVHNALQTMDQRTFYRISGKMPPSRLFELSQEFYFPTPQLLKKWEGREMPDDQAYIEA